MGKGNRRGMVNNRQELWGNLWRVKTPAIQAYNDKLDYEIFAKPNVMVSYLVLLWRKILLDNFSPEFCHAWLPRPYLAGNIGRVDFITENEYDLFVRPDTCNPRVRQANSNCREKDKRPKWGLAFW